MRCALGLGLVISLLVGCGKQDQAPVGLGSGQGVFLSIPRKLAIWTAIRATETDRVLGWSDPTPAVWVYPKRDIQPVLNPDGGRKAIVWLDRDQVIGIQKITGGETAVIPPKEVTQVLVVPLDTDLGGLTVGDRVQVLGTGHDG